MMICLLDRRKTNYWSLVTRKPLALRYYTEDESSINLQCEDPQPSTPAAEIMGEPTNKMGSGHYCTYKNCGISFKSRKPGVHYFRFPKDKKQCEEWLRCCGREELIPQNVKSGDLYNKRRMCSLHFNDDMFMGPAKNKLLPLAIPKTWTPVHSSKSDSAIELECDNPQPSISSDIKDPLECMDEKVFAQPLPLATPETWAPAHSTGESHFQLNVNTKYKDAQLSTSSDIKDPLECMDENVFAQPFPLVTPETCPASSEDNSAMRMECVEPQPSTSSDIERSFKKKQAAKMGESRKRKATRYSCTFKDCDKYFNSKEAGVRTFRFPEDKQLYEKWLRCCGREDLIIQNPNFENLYNKRRMCSRHFDNDMFTGPAKRTLLPSAIPRPWAPPDSTEIDAAMKFECEEPKVSAPSDIEKPFECIDDTVFTSPLLRAALNTWGPSQSPKVDSTMKFECEEPQLATSSDKNRLESNEREQAGIMGKHGRKVAGGCYCAYKDCARSFNLKEPGVHYFRFPRDKKLCEEWLKCCGREDLIPQNLKSGDLYKSRRMCSLHFDDDMFMGPAKNRLLPLATPKMWVPVPSTESDSTNESESEDSQPSTSIDIKDPLECINAKVFTQPLPLATPETWTPVHSTGDDAGLRTECEDASDIKDPLECMDAEVFTQPLLLATPGTWTPAHSTEGDSVIKLECEEPQPSTSSGNKSPFESMDDKSKIFASPLPLATPNSWAPTHSTEIGPVIKFECEDPQLSTSSDNKNLFECIDEKVFTQPLAIPKTWAPSYSTENDSAMKIECEESQLSTSNDINNRLDSINEREQLQTKIMDKRARRLGGGHYCTYRNCGRSFNTREPGVRFFRFPKDQQQCETWLRCSGREDLIAQNVKPGYFYNKRRMCSVHFDDDMFVGPAKNKVLPLAIPKMWVPTHSIESDFVELDPQPSTSSDIKEPFEDMDEKGLAFTQKIKIRQDLQGSEVKSLYP